MTDSLLPTSTEEGKEQTAEAKVDLSGALDQPEAKEDQPEASTSFVTSLSKEEETRLLKVRS